MHKLGDYLERPADPFNEFEPVDSSAAAIAAQALLRLGHFLTKHGGLDEGKRYWQAGLTVLNTLFEEPYLNVNAKHEGLILHSVYHRPNRWDHVASAGKLPSGESSIWGDYHAREVALYIQRIIENKPYLTFFGAYK